MLVELRHQLFAALDRAVEFVRQGGRPMGEDPQSGQQNQPE
jgi:hypothetical protein